jgi:hypothetical protein
MTDTQWASLRVREMLERVQRMAASEWLRLSNELLGPPAPPAAK